MASNPSEFDDASPQFVGPAQYLNTTQNDFADPSARALDDCIAQASGIGRGRSGPDGPMSPTQTVFSHGVDSLNSLSNQQQQYQSALREMNFYQGSGAAGQDVVNGVAPDDPSQDAGFVSGAGM